VSIYLDEAQIEIVTMDYLRDIGYVCTFGPDISPGGQACERRDYDQVVLIGRIQNAIENINPNITPDTEKFVEEASI
jgi:type I restriction enzyme R subunit